MAKNCASCKHWEQTHIEVVAAQPHQQKAVEREQARLHNRFRLCSWIDNTLEALIFVNTSPPWIARRIGGGELTEANEGGSCPTWEPLPATSPKGSE